MSKKFDVSQACPRLALPFEDKIDGRYKHRELSVEVAFGKMYQAGVSLRRVEDITEALRGTRVGSSKIWEMNQKIYERIEEWRRRPIEGEHICVYLDFIGHERNIPQPLFLILTIICFLPTWKS